MKYILRSVSTKSCSDRGEYDYMKLVCFGVFSLARIVKPHSHAPTVGKTVDRRYAKERWFRLFPKGYQSISVETVFKCLEH